jgi:hypothetical protein
VKLLTRLSFLSLFLSSTFLVGCGSGPVAPPTDEEQRQIDAQMQQEMETMPTLPQHLD